MMDAIFAGSIPKLYETHLVPLIFEPYAPDLARRLASNAPGRVLELAAGTGIAGRYFLTGHGKRAGPDRDRAGINGNRRLYDVVRQAEEERGLARFQIIQ